MNRANKHDRSCFDWCPTLARPAVACSWFAINIGHEPMIDRMQKKRLMNAELPSCGIMIATLIP